MHLVPGGLVVTTILTWLLLTAPGCAPCTVPTLGAPGITPTAADTTQDLTLDPLAGWDAVDPDDVAISWTVDGVEVSTTDTLPAGTAPKGSTVVVELTWSGCEQEVQRASAPLVVDNALPVADGAEVSPTAPVSTRDHLQCRLTAPPTDADGDALTPTFYWTQNGTAVTVDGSVVHPGDTVPASRLAEGDTWTCEIRVSDDEDESAPVTASATVAGRRAVDVDLGAGVCILMDDGTLECHASNSAGGTDLPLTGNASIWSGTNGWCVLDELGEATCKRSVNRQNELAPEPSGPFEALAVMERCAVGLRTDGSLAWWGRSTGDCEPNVVDTYTTLGSEPGSGRVCGIRTAGGIACWGAPYDDAIKDAIPRSGQFTDIGVTRGGPCAIAANGTIGCATSDPGNALAQAPAGNTWEEIVGGKDHACARDAAGAVVCWGDENDGQLDVPAGLVATTLAANGDDTCAVTDDGDVVCWGDILDGYPYHLRLRESVLEVRGVGFLELCVRTTAGAWDCASGVGSTFVPPVGPGPFQAIDTWTNAICTIAEGEIACSIRDIAEQTPWLPVPTGTDFAELAVGQEHACALRTDGTPVCWGDDTYGQATPPRGATFEELCATRDRTCGRRPDGTAVCWGAGTTDRPNPQTKYQQLACSVNIGCGLTEEGAVSCWRGSDPSPLDGDGAVEVAVGQSIGCARYPDSSVACWSDAGTTEFDLQPAPNTGFVGLDAVDDDAVMCGVRDNGRVECWGWGVWR